MLQDIGPPPPSSRVWITVFIVLCEDTMMTGIVGLGGLQLRQDPREPPICGRVDVEKDDIGLVGREACSNAPPDPARLPPTPSRFPAA